MLKTLVSPRTSSSEHERISEQNVLTKLYDQQNIKKPNSQSLLKLLHVVTRIKLELSLHHGKEVEGLKELLIKCFMSYICR
jgi:hypothetical protein